MELTGWLFDLYPAPEGGVVVWLLGEDGVRRRLHQPFPVTFYAAGPAARLRALWRWLEAQPVPVQLSREERRDLFCEQPVTVLAARMERAAAQPRLFQRAARVFPELTYYDADIPLTLRHAAAHRVFPLARCRVSADEEGRIQAIEPLDTPWELDPARPPLKTLSLAPDADPARNAPRGLKVGFERGEYYLALEPARALVIGLRAILQRHDPDLLVTAWGDTWLLPELLRLAEETGLPLPLNRDQTRAPEHRKERSYFSYGQVIHQGRQVHLFGRWHIDRYNAMLFHDYGMEGIFELARVTALPVQTVARVSPGSGISAMQMLTALRQGVLVPWHKQQAERPKTALDLLRADQGGLVYQPVTGLHQHVAEIDFISMYPSIMVKFNVSPETVGSAGHIAARAVELGDPYEGDEPQGLVPATLEPLLEKRVALKGRLANLSRWDPQRKVYQARASAHKWLLVTCFGYLGYKNARFGRIEAHEAVTAYGREALLRAKEAAEDLGCRVLHLYVDGMWVSKPGASKKEDFQSVLDEIAARTSLYVAIEGIYNWLAFLPSRQDPRVPVANRYFGAFEEGELKLRGIEARRRDTPPFIAQTQRAILRILAEARTPEAAEAKLHEILGLMQERLAALQEGRLPPESLLVAQKLSRTLDEYRALSPVARAVAQLEEAGKSVSPGERVRFLYTRGEPGVHAWNAPHPPDPDAVDVARYTELLLRAASSVLEPFGLSRTRLENWLLSNAAYNAPPGRLPPGEPAPPGRPALPLWRRPASEAADLFQASEVGLIGG